MASKNVAKSSAQVQALPAPAPPLPLPPADAQLGLFESV